MVKKISYFCTASHTEFGGIDAFLIKINDRVNWRRQFPTAEKKGPRPTQSDRRDMSMATISSQVEGATGRQLRAKMLEIIRRYPENFSKENCDGILLIDDADCRFTTYEEFDHWRQEISNEIVNTLGYSIPLYVLLASPEIEAWFLMDWASAFAKEYQVPAGFENRLKHYLSTTVVGLEMWGSIENFGGPTLNGTCTVKLSNEIINAFENQDLLEPYMERYSDFLTKNRLSYSKKRNGARMLSRICPNQISERCRTFFSPTYRELFQIGLK